MAADMFQTSSMRRKNVKKLALIPVQSRAGDPNDTPPATTLTTPTTSTTPLSLRASSNRMQSLLFSSKPLEISDECRLDIDPNDLIELSEIGQGHGSSVSKVQHVGSNIIMARKVIHVEAKVETRRRIMRELQIMHECDSPYIISFYGAFINESQDVVICMEYMDCGALDAICSRSGPIRVDVVGKIAAAVLAGLTYLYLSHSIMHRDVKPSNILVNSRGQIKLCDFGVSSQLENSVAETFVGTGTYMAPERIQGGQYTFKSDVWSVGLTLIELATGRFPLLSSGVNGSNDFNDSSEWEPQGIVDLLHRIILAPAPRLPESDRYPNDLRKFIERCVVKDPNDRPTPLELYCGDPFIIEARKTPVDLGAWAMSVAGKDFVASVPPCEFPLPLKKNKKNWRNPQEVGTFSTIHKCLISPLPSSSFFSSSISGLESQLMSSTLPAPDAPKMQHPSRPMDPNMMDTTMGGCENEENGKNVDIFECSYQVNKKNGDVTPMSSMSMSMLDAMGNLLGMQPRVRRSASSPDLVMTTEQKKKCFIKPQIQYPASIMAECVEAMGAHSEERSMQCWQVGENSQMPNPLQQRLKAHSLLPSPSQSPSQQPQSQSLKADTVLPSPSESPSQQSQPQSLPYSSSSSSSSYSQPLNKTRRWPQLLRHLKVATSSSSSTAPINFYAQPLPSLSSSSLMLSPASSPVPPLSDSATTISTIKSPLMLAPPASLITRWNESGGGSNCFSSSSCSSSVPTSSFSSSSFTSTRVNQQSELQIATATTATATKDEHDEKEDHAFENEEEEQDEKKRKRSSSDEHEHEADSEKDINGRYKQPKTQCLGSASASGSSISDDAGADAGGVDDDASAAGGSDGQKEEEEEEEGQEEEEEEDHDHDHDHDHNNSYDREHECGEKNYMYNGSPYSYPCSESESSSEF